jgi:Na+-transporting methylmalonyl-CoA/oxaloacetate decarboxylase gamma subunit
MFALAFVFLFLLILPLLVWAVGHNDRGKKP